MDFLTLDLKGFVLALLFGILFLFFGGDIGYFFVIAMAVFLALSAVVTRVGIEYKKAIGVYQKYRGIKNVIANGAAPLIFAFLFYFYSKTSVLNSSFMLVAFVASVAAITADKFSSEIGVFGGTPRMIFTFKKVKRGTSGGVTILGLIAGLLGAFLISLLGLLVQPWLGIFHSVFATTFFSGVYATRSVISIIVGGYLGNIADTVLGYYEEKGIGNKFTTNFFCSAAGGLFAMILFGPL